MASFRQWPTRAWALIRLGRPLFLVGGLVMHLLGAAAALYAGAQLDVRLLLLGQAAVTAAQLMTHYANDAFDLAADRANRTPTRWSGGSRVLTDGILSPTVSFGMALFLGAISLGTGLALTAQRPLALLIVALAVMLSAAYSAPPARLHSSGFGELAAALIVCGLTPLLGFVLQMGTITALPLLASASLLPLQVAMLVGVAFPDAASDEQAGKRTLVVRTGERAGQWYIGLIAAAYVLLPLWVWLGLPAVVAKAILLTLPLGIWQAVKVARGAWRDPARQDALAFGGIALLVAAALAELAVFLSGAGA